MEANMEINLKVNIIVHANYVVIFKIIMLIERLWVFRYHIYPTPPLG